MRPKTKKLTTEQQAFVEQNMGLVSAVIQKKLNKTSPYYSDAYQAGYMGLCNAVLGYDKCRNTEFSTYATTIIQHHISKCIVAENKYHSHENGYLDNVHDGTSFAENETAACEKLTFNLPADSEYKQTEIRIILEDYIRKNVKTEKQLKRVMAFIYQQEGYSCDESARLVDETSITSRNLVHGGKEILQGSKGLKECLTD